MWWLQGKHYFADLRTSLGSAASAVSSAAFSGRVAWDPPRIVFHRDLDLGQEPVADQAELEVSADALIESGVVCHEGHQIPYVEQWVRERGSGTARRVLDGLDRHDRCSMRLVEIDGFAIVMVDGRSDGTGFSACQFVLRQNAWTQVRRLGAATIPAPPSMPEFRATATHLIAPAAFGPLWAERRWLVRELE